MNTLEKLKELRNRVSESYSISKSPYLQATLELLDILIAEREASQSSLNTKVEEPEIRPRASELWQHRSDAYPYFIVSDEDEYENGTHLKVIWPFHYGTSSGVVYPMNDRPAFLTDRGEMIHGKNGWQLIFSPYSQRMQLIQEEKK